MENMNFQEEMKIKEMNEKEEECKIERSKADVIQRRTATREGLRKYEQEVIENVIEFKLRLPNSSIKRLRLPKTEKVSYLFNFIECLEEEEIGFDNEFNRMFDILQPYEKVSLKNKQ